jgi:4-hydroxybutyrate CoA-transferase
MTVQVKYCGGCNPGYDRTGLIRRIPEDFPGVNIVYETPSRETVDFVLVVCGCPVRCASHGGIRGLYGKWIISSPGEYPLLYEELRRVESKTGKADPAEQGGDREIHKL